MKTLTSPSSPAGHIVHEVTSPQAFEGLSKAGRKVRRLDGTLATVDHNVSVPLASSPASSLTADAVHSPTQPDLEPQAVHRLVELHQGVRAVFSLLDLIDPTS